MKADSQQPQVEHPQKAPLSPLRYPSLHKAHSEQVSTKGKQASKKHSRDIPQVITYLLNKEKFQNLSNSKALDKSIFSANQEHLAKRQSSLDSPDVSLKAIHLSDRMGQPQICKVNTSKLYPRRTLPQKNMQICTLRQIAQMRTFKEPLTPCQPATIVRRNVNRKKILESIPRSKMSNNVRDYLSVERISIRQMEDSLLSHKNKAAKGYRMSNLLQFDSEKQIFNSYQSQSINNNSSISPDPKHKNLILKRSNRKFKPSHELYYYRDFMWKVAYSNEFIVANVEQYKVKIYVGGGNNSNLIKSIIRRRPWWIVTDKQQEANLVWTQLKVSSMFGAQPKRQRPQAPVKENQYISSKASGNPLLNKEEKEKWKKYWEANLEKEMKMKECLKSRSKVFGIEQVSLEDVRGKVKIHNHFINNFIIGNKKALFQTMSEYYGKTNKNVFDYLPLTFHIKQGLGDDQYLKFCQHYFALGKAIKQDPQHLNKFNAWIVKPGQNTNRGNGIIVCLQINEIKAILKRQEKHNDGTLKTYILQKYIEKPLLYKKRKFDLRHFMMINCSNGIMKGYWYREGYVRTTSAQYTLKQSSGGVHLTNDAVQKFLPDYGKFQKGNKIFYEELDTYMKKQDPSFDFNQIIYPKMKTIATDIIRASALNIDPGRRVNNFQIFGLDFMVDADYGVWLIEVNTNPCLETTCPVLAKIIPQFIEATLQVCVDPVFGAPLGFKPKYQSYLQKTGEINQLQLVFDERVQKVTAVGQNVVALGVEQDDDVFDDDGDQLDDNE